MGSEPLELKSFTDDVTLGIYDENKMLTICLSFWCKNANDYVSESVDLNIDQVKVLYKYIGAFLENK